MSRGRLLGRLAAIDDGAILRVAFFALLAGTASVLFVDFRELMASNVEALPSIVPQPILPPVQPSDDPEGRPMPEVNTPRDVLDDALTIELGTGGILSLTGTIDVGSATRFAEEIAARGEYVDTVELNSPGGSVQDALAIGRLVQEKGLGTRVNGGHLCASSCPVILASGTDRQISRNAAVGVHQIYASALGSGAVDALRVAGVAMSDAQSITAEITRHLTSAGVDPAIWLHALETPPDQLYYLTPEEMENFRLATTLTD